MPRTAADTVYGREVTLLHDRYPTLRSTLPQVRLGRAPTPVRGLPDVAAGSAEVWVKEEGTFGDGPWGGNKVRKLEWLLPDVHRRGRSTMFTVGGLGTHWGLAAALYGREHGLHTALALVDQPIDDHVREQLSRLRNSGATLHLTRTKRRTILRAPRLLWQHRDGLRPPYFLPAGGSSPVGAVAYVEVGLEIGAQVAAGDLPAPGHLVVPVGSGGTAAGLLVGLRLAGLDTKVVAVVVNDQLRLDAETLTELAVKTEDLLRERGADVPGAVEPDRLQVTHAWLGPTYGAATPAGERAQAVGEAAGLAMEPVYTAKALAAVRGLDEDGAFGAGPVLYLHTHGPR